MDLGSFGVLRTSVADLHLCDPFGKPLVDEETREPVTISLVSADSDDWDEAERRFQQEQIDKRVKSPRVVGANMTAKELKDRELWLLTAATKGWKHVRCSLVGEGVLSLTEENVFKLYGTLKFVRDQVRSFVLDPSNFLRESSRSS